MFFNKSNLRGVIGEGVARLFMLGLNKDEYKTINNITLRTPQGKTTQIDHIIVSIYGIFVIETKNFKGWIYGSEDSRHWTQVLYKKKSQFYNPVKQNQGHIYALKNLLSQSSGVPYISIVSFSPEATLRTINVTSRHTFVVYMHEVKCIIRSFKEVVFSNSDVKDIANQIQKSNMLGLDVKMEHVRNIRSIINEKQQAIQYGSCPKCTTGKLTERSGPYGRFKGCSNFPRCTFKSK